MSDNNHNNASPTASASPEDGFTLRITPDKLEVYLEGFTCSQGDRAPIDVEQILKALEAHDVSYGVDKDHLTEVLSQLNKMCDAHIDVSHESILIAEGQAAIDAQEARLDWAIDETQAAQPDFIVLPDQLIATYHSAVAGTPGMDVLGNPIPANGSAQAIEGSLGNGINTIATDAGEEYRAAWLGKLSYQQNGQSIQLDVTPNFTVSEDGMQVRMELPSQAGNGEAVTKQHVLASLATCGIAFGIDEAMIDKALSGPDVAIDVVVAQGTEMEPGTDGSLQLCYGEHSAGHETEDGRIDFREQDYPINVSQGDDLGLLTLPIPGKDGTTVQGTTVRAPATKAADVTLDGIHRDEQGRLIADRDGALIINSSALSIVELLEIKGDVAGKTGNIHSNIPVHVRGHVEPGYVLESQKDVIIDKNVEDATIHAGGDITIKGGIRGMKSLLQTPGDLHVGFVENAQLNATGDVTISQSVINSKIACDGVLTVGGGKRGSVMGGELIANQIVNVVELGSPAGHKVHVHVGLAQETRKALNQLEKAITTKEHELQQLSQIEQLHTHKPKAGSDEILRKVAATRSAQAEALEQLKQQRQTLETEIAESNQAKVIIQRRVYPGAIITINNHTYEVKNEFGTGEFVLNLEKGMVVFRTR